MRIMNILHLSDLHFGPRHWDGDDEVLLEKINSYPADVVIDTGDTTTDGRECEYAEARRFFDKINCEHFVAVIGNHDKRNTVGHDHLLRLENTCDLYANHRFYHFMCGTTASANTPRDDNVFLFHENVGDDNFHLYVIRLLHKDGRLEFKEEKIR